MTREDYKKASHLVNDIETLESIKKTQDANHWVEFRTADEKNEMLSIYSDDFYDDFKKFVIDELKKLNESLEKI